MAGYCGTGSLAGWVRAVLWIMLVIFGWSGYTSESLAAPSRLQAKVARFKQGNLLVIGSYKGTAVPNDGLVKFFDAKLQRLLGQMALTELPVKENKRAFRFSLANPYDVPCVVRVSAAGVKDKLKKVRGAPKKNCSTGKTPPVAVVPAPTPEPAPIDPAPTPTPTPSPSLQPVCEILEPVAGAALTAHKPISFRGRLKANDAAAPTLAYEWDFAGGAMERPKGTVTGEEAVEAQPTFVRDNSTYRVRLFATDSIGRRCEAAVDVAVGTPAAGLPAKVPEQLAPPVAAALDAPAGALVVLPFEDWTMQHMTDARTVRDLLVNYGPMVSNINAAVYRKARQPQKLAADQVNVLYSAASNPKDPVGAGSINSTSQNWPLGASLLDAALAKTDIFDAGTSADGSYRYSYASFAAGFYDLKSGLIPNLADEGYHGANLNPPLNPDHGRYMPGIATPYSVNDPQPFGVQRAGDDWLTARALPVTDVDDAGRVNPYPLFRIQAQEPGQPIAATTDTVLTVSRDFHCRECHAAGKLGANPNVVRAAAHSNHGGVHHALTFFPPETDSLFDQEYAAIKNIGEIHLLGSHHNAIWQFMGLGGNGPTACGSTSCHMSALAQLPYGAPVISGSTATGLSYDVHRIHGRMQYNARRDDVVRYESGAPIPADLDTWDAATGSIPNSLFPVKDAQGKPLPMEENCLRCHAGEREQCYRDRMYTAGVTCYQCHGDLLAVSGIFPKSRPDADARMNRNPWFDQPDCATCHTGNGNRGKDGTDGFFSDGVQRTAFDETDPSATPRQPNRFDPDASRFAVTPLNALDFGQYELDAEGGTRPVLTQTRLFRLGKDDHGGVACSACHGAAHGIWPNRDPNANDNVTAIQLQGHSGQIIECGVCHAADAFAKVEDLDEGAKHLDPKAGILGGPHNLHPVNDPTWWLSAHSPNGVVKGGWHVDYTKRPGRSGEDQCEACHGNDRLGTRLSKTPVDRDIVDELGNPIHVAAGTPISCALCHSVEKSCKGSPNLTDCGKPSERTAADTHPAPVFRSQPPLKAIVGQDYEYHVDVVDPEGSNLWVRLALPAAYGVVFDGATRTVRIPLKTDSALLSNMMTTLGNPPLRLNFAIVAANDRGAYSSQTATVVLDCPAGSAWSPAGLRCATVGLTTAPPLRGLNAGTVFHYSVAARQGNGLPLTYHLEGAPPGMTIGATDGLIDWTAQSSGSQDYQFTITADDGQGGQDSQLVSLLVCVAPELWNVARFTCDGPVSIAPLEGSLGTTGGEVFTYAVSASHRDGLPLSFHLDDAPDGMTIDAQTGVVRWQAQADTSQPVAFTVTASDTQGYAFQWQFSVMVCAGLEHWQGGETSNCVGLINFTQLPNSNAVTEGDRFQGEFSATHYRGLPITYRLADGSPAGMTIDAKTGIVSWRVIPMPDNYAFFSVVASDTAGNTGQADWSLSVCNNPMRFDNSQGICVGAIHIDSTPPGGIDGNGTFVYPVHAVHDHGLAMTYRIADGAPESINIDANGKVTWNSKGFDFNSGSQVSFDVIVSDAVGNRARQSVNFMVCQPRRKWYARGNSCYLPQ